MQALKTIRQIKRIRGKAILPFLLGVVAAKTNIRLRSNVLTISFQGTRAHLAYLLKHELGGTVWQCKNKGSTMFETRYQLASKAGFKKLQQAVQTYGPALPAKTFDRLSAYLALRLK